MQEKGNKIAQFIVVSVCINSKLISSCQKPGILSLCDHNGCFQLVIVKHV